jgi:hypothetical protein
MNKSNKEIIKHSCKFLGLFGMAYLAGLPQVPVAMAGALGLGQESVKNLFSLVGNLFSGFSSNSLTDIGKEVQYQVNHDLQRELESAYEETFKQIELIILETEENDSGSIFTAILHPAYFRQLRRERLLLRQTLIDPILTALKSEVEMSLMLSTNGQLEPDRYLAELIDKNIAGIEFVNAESDRSVFIDEICQHFKLIFPSKFLTALKKNENARTAYFKHLLEGVALQTQLNGKELVAIRQLAAQTNNDLSVLREGLLQQNLSIQGVSEKMSEMQAALSEMAMLSREGEEALRQLLLQNQAPVLTIDTSNFGSLDNPNLYHFRYQFTHLYGREREVSQLRDFIYQPTINGNRFSWCLLTGEGGAGKSRLAQELSLEAAELGYYAGFYSASQFNIDSPAHWSRWNPSLPVLIVIDYALANSQKVIEIIRILERLNVTATELGSPVRLLLLERASSQNWEERVKAIPALNSTRFANISLGPLDSESQWLIIRDVLQKVNPQRLGPLEKAKADWLKTLNDIDPKRRPLFSFLTAMALSESDNIRSWNKHQLLSHVNSRMIELWRRYPVYQKYESLINQLLVFNTLCRYLAHTQLEDLCYEWDAEADYQEIEPVYFIFTDQTIGEKTGKQFQLGIQPDILGEYFVLNYLGSLLQGGRKRKEQAENLVQKAWQFLPEQTRWTVWLTFYDYATLQRPDYDDLEFDRFNAARDFLLKPQWIEQANAAIANELAILYEWVAEEYCAKLQAEQAALYIQKVRTLVDRFPGNLTIFRSLLTAVSSFCWHLPEQELLIEEYMLSCRKISVDNDVSQASIGFPGILRMVGNYVYKAPVIDVVKFRSWLTWVEALADAGNGHIRFENKLALAANRSAFVSREGVPLADCIESMILFKDWLKNEESVDAGKLWAAYAKAILHFVKRFHSVAKPDCVQLLKELAEEYKALGNKRDKLFTEEYVRAITTAVECWSKDEIELSMQWIEQIKQVLSDSKKPLPVGDLAFNYSYAVWKFIESNVAKDHNTCVRYFEVVHQLIENDWTDDPQVAALWIFMISILSENLPDDSDNLDQLTEMFNAGLYFPLHLKTEESANLLASFLKFWMRNADSHNPNDLLEIKILVFRIYSQYKTRSALAAVLMLNRLHSTLVPAEAAKYQEDSQLLLNRFNESSGTMYTIEQLLES